MNESRQQHVSDADPKHRSDGALTVAFEERSYDSRSLGRRQPYACFLPPGAAHSGRAYPLLILLHGVTGDFADWARYTRLARYLQGEELIVVCPDGDEGWYTNGVNSGERREDDILEDLLPHLERTLPLLPWPARAIGGLSMGGYGAVKLALKHPVAFRVAVSHSGALDITSRPEPHAVFGDAAAHAAERRLEDPRWLAEQALSRPPAERPQLFLDCGAADPLAVVNRTFSDHLNFIGYGHTYREMPGHHTWPYWDRAFRTVLPDLMRVLRAGLAP
jgi:S-formylglutathione hydrolase FrmB